jgi:hypothetical protein
MATPTTIAEALERTALNPRVGATDKGRIESQSLLELLEVLRHDAGQDAAAKNHFGLRSVRLESPGAG